LATIQKKEIQSSIPPDHKSSGKDSAGLKVLKQSARPGKGSVAVEPIHPLCPNRSSYSKATDVWMTEHETNSAAMILGPSQTHRRQAPIFPKFSRNIQFAVKLISSQCSDRR
jgi:hypothetical protein